MFIISVEQIGEVTVSVRLFIVLPRFLILNSTQLYLICNVYKSVTSCIIIITPVAKWKLTLLAQ